MTPEIGKLYKAKDDPECYFIIKPVEVLNEGFKVVIVKSPREDEGHYAYWGPSAYRRYTELTELEKALL
jgi:hypothetical protein